MQRIWVFSNFDCRKNNLTSFKYSPIFVRGNFNGQSNIVNSLEGSSKTTLGSFDCSKNNLVNLIGAPDYVGIKFKCSYNKIYSFIYFPKYVGGLMDFRDNPGISQVKPQHFNELYETYVAQNQKQFLEDNLVELNQVANLKNISKI